MQYCFNPRMSNQKSPYLIFAEYYYIIISGKKRPMTLISIFTHFYLKSNFNSKGNNLLKLRKKIYLLQKIINCSVLILVVCLENKDDNIHLSKFK